jgi:hypothetical protein
MNANRRQPMGASPRLLPPTTARSHSIQVAMRDVTRNFREAFMDNSGYIIASS